MRSPCTIPEPEALAALTRTPGYLSATAGFLASIVVWPGGQCQPNCHPILSPDEWIASAAKDHCVRAKSSTFVSVMVSRDAVRTQGLPLRPLFLIWDDTEFTERISRSYPCYFVLDSVAIHKTPDHGYSGQSNFSIKTLYHQRKRVVYIKLLPISSWKKSYRIFKLVVRDCLYILLLRYQFRHLLWTVRGICLPVKVELPD